MPRHSTSTQIVSNDAALIMPAMTPDTKESELIALATQLAEQQLRDGTASAQVIAHYLKLGTTRERLEKERLMEENKLLRAKTENLKAAARTEELFSEAIAAMKRYSGNSGDIA